MPTTPDTTRQVRRHGVLIPYRGGDLTTDYQMIIGPVEMKDSLGATLGVHNKDGAALTITYRVLGSIIKTPATFNASTYANEWFPLKDADGTSEFTVAAANSEGKKFDFPVLWLAVIAKSSNAMTATANLGLWLRKV